MLRYCLLVCFCILSCSVLAHSADTLKIYYPIDVFKLTDGDKKRLADHLHAAKSKQIIIRGFTDYLGNPEYNLALSSKRAETVKAYLVSVDPQIMAEVVGKGEIDDPIKYKEGNPETRRVEVIIINQAGTAPAPPPITIAKSQPPVLIAQKIDSIAIKNQQFKNKIDSLFKGGAGTSLALNEFNFLPGTHRLTGASIKYMPVLLSYMLAHRETKIEIQGHICCDPDGRDGFDYDSNNYKLSTNRAKAIYDYLAQNGVRKRQMRYKGFAMSRPKVFPELTPADENTNRRVEILILEN